MITSDLEIKVLCYFRERIGDVYARHSGYNEVGEMNDIIILYPQVSVSALNLMGCWDWFAYTGIYYGMYGIGGGYTGIYYGMYGIGGDYTGIYYGECGIGWGVVLSLCLKI